MNQSAVAHLFHESLVERISATAGTLLEPKTTGWDEAQSEELFHRRLDLAVGQFHLVAEIEGGGLGLRSDRGEGDPALGRLRDLSAAAGTPRGVMLEAGHHGDGAQFNVLLQVDAAVAPGRVGRAFAVGTL